MLTDEEEMDDSKFFRQMVTCMIFLSVLVGCSSMQSTPSAPLSAPTLIADRGDKEWDYVAMGNSTQFALVSRYAAILEKELNKLLPFIPICQEIQLPYQL